MQNKPIDCMHENQPGSGLRPDQKKSNRKNIEKYNILIGKCSFKKRNISHDRLYVQAYIS